MTNQISITCPNNLIYLSYVGVAITGMGLGVGVVKCLTIAYEKITKQQVDATKKPIRTYTKYAIGAVIGGLVCADRYIKYLNTKIVYTGNPYHLLNK